MDQRAADRGSQSKWRMAIVALVTKEAAQAGHTGSCPAGEMLNSFSKFTCK